MQGSNESRIRDVAPATCNWREQRHPRRDAVLESLRSGLDPDGLKGQFDQFGRNVVVRRRTLRGHELVLSPCEAISKHEGSLLDMMGQKCGAGKQT